MPYLIITSDGSIVSTRRELVDARLAAVAVKTQLGAAYGGVGIMREPAGKRLEVGMRLARSLLRDVNWI